PFTATPRRARPASAPVSSPAWLTKFTAHDDNAAPNDPNIGRAITGCGVGIDALPSPIIAPAMDPPLTITSGLTPKNAGFHSTRSASFPTSIDPTSAAMPWVIAGLIVYLAM